MMVYLVTFIIIALAILGMAVGVVLSDRRLKGSCGGLNTIQGLEGSCGCEKHKQAVYITFTRLVLLI